MSDKPNGVVRWKSFTAILIGLASILIGYSLHLHEHMDEVEAKMVTRIEFDKSEKHLTQFFQEYREDQKSQDKILRKLLEKVSKLER